MDQYSIICFNVRLMNFSCIRRICGWSMVNGSGANIDNCPCATCNSNWIILYGDDDDDGVIDDGSLVCMDVSWSTNACHWDTKRSYSSSSTSSPIHDWNVCRIHDDDDEASGIDDDDIEDHYKIDHGITQLASKQHSFSPYEMNGGTVAAISGKNFCVIASDTRCSSGYEILSRNVSHLHTLNANNILASSGCKTDIDQLRSVLDIRFKVSLHPVFYFWFICLKFWQLILYIFFF